VKLQKQHVQYAKKAKRWFRDPLGRNVRKKRNEANLAHSESHEAEMKLGSKWKKK